MRVAFILRSEFGLLGANASYMFPSVVARRHDVLVLTSPTGPAEADLAVFSDPNVMIARLTSDTLAGRAEEAMAYLERFQPDVVHVFNFRDCLLYPVMARLRLRRRCAWVLDIRTPLLEEDEALRRRIRMKNLLLQWAVDHVCTHEESSVPTHFPRLYRPSSLVRPGVDMAAFKPPLPKSGLLRRYVFIGSIARRRKIDFLIRSFAAFAQRVDDGVTLDIYGGGNRLEAMRALVRSLGMDGVITLHGARDQAELFRVLPTYDAAIGYVPQGAFNNAPALKVLEYAAAGLPIFASDLSGLKRLRRHGFRIVYFQNKRDAFVRALRGNRRGADGARKAAHNWKTVQAFDWAHIVESELYPVYDKLLKDHHDSAPDLAHTA